MSVLLRWLFCVLAPDCNAFVTQTLHVQPCAQAARHPSSDLWHGPPMRRREADKVNRGKPTLKPWEEVGLESSGAEDDLQQLQQADAAAVAMAGLKLADAPEEEAATGAASQPGSGDGRAEANVAADEAAEAPEPAAAGGEPQLAPPS